MPSYLAQATSIPVGLLDGMTDAQLVELLTSRPDLTDPAPANLAALEHRAEGWNSVRDCYYALDLAGQQVMQALSLLPPATTPAALAGLLGPDVTEDLLEPVLDRLAALALLTRDDALRVAQVWHDHGSRAGLGPPLADLLPRLSADELRRVAEHVGAQRHARKDDLAASIRATLTTPGRISELLSAAPEPVVELAMRLADGPPTVEVPYYYAPGGRREQTPIDWLRAHGLLVGPGWGQATMAREVAIALRGGQVFPELQLTRPELELLPANGAAVDSGGFERATQLTHQLLRMLEELEQRPAALLKSGGIGVRDVRRVASVLGVSEPVAAQHLELAAAAGLLGRDKDRGRLLLGPGYDAWRDGDTASRWLVLVQAWQELPHQLSLAGSPDANDKAIPPLVGHRADGSAGRLRRVLLSILASAPAGSAVTDESLMNALVRAAPLGWTVRPTDLFGDLQLLGLATGAALGSLGRALAEGGLAEALVTMTMLLPKPVTEFVLQGDLTAIASGELAPLIRTELELMADRESSGGAAVYRFSPESLRRALDQARDGATLLTFLREHAPRGVPQALEYLITDLGRRYGHLRLSGAGCYVRSDDTALLTELTTSRAFARFGFSLIAPTVLVSNADEPTVLAALRAEGYLPALEGPGGVIRMVLPDRPRAHAAATFLRVDGPDLPALVARLRQPQPALSLVGSGARPTFRASDPALMPGLLRLAIAEEWAIGVTYQAAELIVWPWEVCDDHLYGENALTGAELVLALKDVRSIRVLGEDEQDRTLLEQ